MGLRSFYYFSKHIYGNADMDEEVHGDMCEALQDLEHMKDHGIAKLMILMPRGHLKSSVCTESYVVWRLLRNPNLRVLIANEVYEKARDFLVAIKACFESNEKFRALYGDLINDPDSGRPALWNIDRIALSSRTVVRKEPNISTGGPGKTKTGMHYDLVIADDLISEKTITTPEQIKKSHDYYKMLQSLLDPGSEMVIIGTRYMYDDLYGTLMELGSMDRVIVKRAVAEDGSILWPRKFSKATLDELEKELGPWFFGCQYQNEPTNADTAVFLEEEFKYIGLDCKEPEDWFYRAALIDPSRGETQDSDFTAIVIASMDDKQNVYIEHAEQRRVPKPADLMSWLYSLDRWCKDKYGRGFDTIGVEQVAMQNISDWMLAFIEAGNGRWLPIIPVRTQTTIGKVERIRSMQPWFRQGKIYLYNELTELKTQLVRFPNISKDDLIDAMSMSFRVLQPGIKEENDKAGEMAERTDVARLKSDKHKETMDAEVGWMFWEY